MVNTQLALKDRDTGAELVPMSNAASVLEILARASRDPAIDVNKFERLAALYERIEAKNSEQSFNEAMTAAQSEMKHVRADATNPQTRSQYATYAALDTALRPTYTKNGFALSFDTGDASHPEMVRVLCYVSHKDGHSRTYKIDMPADGKGAKGGDVMTRTHATGSAVSYGRRYLIKSIFNIAEGEDDDGNAAAGGTINEDQLGKIRDLMERTGADIERFCAHFKIDALPSLRAKDFDRAIESLNLKLKQVRK